MPLRTEYTTATEMSSVVPKETRTRYEPTRFACVGTGDQPATCDPRARIIALVPEPTAHRVNGRSDAQRERLAGERPAEPRREDVRDLALLGDLDGRARVRSEGLQRQLSLGRLEAGPGGEVSDSARPACATARSRCERLQPEAESCSCRERCDRARKTNGAWRTEAVDGIESPVPDGAVEFRELARRRGPSGLRLRRGGMAGIP